MIFDQMTTKLDSVTHYRSTGRFVHFLNLRGHFLRLQSISMRTVQQDCRKRFEVYTNGCKIVRGIECDQVKVATTNIKRDTV
jgi:hypothetical protein